MVLRNSERKLVHETLDEVKPYIGEPQLVEQLVDRQLQSTGSIPEFMINLQTEHDNAASAILKTDLRIYIGRLRKKMKY